MGDAACGGQNKYPSKLYMVAFRKLKMEFLSSQLVV